MNSKSRIISTDEDPSIGGPKMSGNFVRERQSGNFVRERQRIVYIYNIHKVGNLISPDEHMTLLNTKYIARGIKNR